MLLNDAMRLGVTEETYTEAGIKKAFRQKAMQVHPDVGGTTEQFMAAEKAQNNLLAAIAEGITAEDIFDDIDEWEYSFAGPRPTTPPPQPKDDDEDYEITSLDLCLLISHISMLYYGDTLELTSRKGRLFRYSPKDFKSGKPVPFLKDYIAWSCETQSGLIEVLQPFEFSYNPRIVLTVTVDNLDIGMHQFIMMFGGRAYPYTFEKVTDEKSYISTEMEFPISFRYVGGVKTDIMLTIDLDLFF